MADGSYSVKKHDMPEFEQMHVNIEMLEFVENNSSGIRKIEVENIIDGSYAFKVYDLN